MPPSGKDVLDSQLKSGLDTIARISLDIRKAIVAALPTPPEQFLTLNIPGKVLNFDDFTDGLDNEGKLQTVLPSLRVQLNEAMLCDDMPTLSGIQLGPTGRSVAMSYGATLSRLCPSGSTTGIPDDSGNLTEEEQQYQKAMEWLLTKDSDFPTKTRIELYREKQTEYTDAFERKLKAFHDALDHIKSDPRYPTVNDQRAAYAQWVQENQKSYNNLIQGAYMDWVTTGRKEQVEYYFSIVDNESAMSRVEGSKKAMREAIISDLDGTIEYNKVTLTPSNWAWIALQKIKAGAPGSSEEALSYEITRLSDLNDLLSGALEDPSVFANGTGDVEPKKPEGVPTSVQKFLQALKAYKLAVVERQQNPNDTKSLAALKAAEETLATARTALSKGFSEVKQYGFDVLHHKAAKSQSDLFNSSTDAIKTQIEANQEKINHYTTQLQDLSTSGGASSLQTELAQLAGIPPPLPEGTGNNTPDFWTKISAEVASSYAADQSQADSNSYSIGAAGIWGLLSIGGSVSHSSQSFSAAQQMASCSVSVSFECMRVDIARGWLRSELFYDSGLKAITGNYISPGPRVLKELMDGEKADAGDENKDLTREQLLQKYDLFPMYPTSFILAANVVLDISGKTSDIQSQFETSSTSAEAYIGYGPFAIQGSYSGSSTSASSTCETTANGCRITIKSPQIIGWVSQIVPALPRYGVAEA